MEMKLSIRPHPGPLPEERESQRQSLVSLADIVAVAALWVIALKSRQNLRVFVSLKAGRRFTLSSGERAGVRANVHQTLPVTPFRRKHRGT
jgi:hypothetical protein